MLQSWWILPLEEQINGTDRIRGSYERRKTLSVQIQADETKSSVLSLNSLLVTGILQEDRMQGRIEITRLKT